MAWRTIDQECSVYDQNGEPLHKTVILVDTEGDIPEPLNEWAVGSMCMIAEDHTYKVLNNEREWA